MQLRRNNRTHGNPSRPAESATVINPSPDLLSHKWRHLALLSLAELLAMTLWFSASAVVPQLAEHWALSSAERSWITMSVQLGFVVGALLSAIFNLPDRIPGRTVFGVSALLAAAANAAIPLLGVGFLPALVLRFLTGMLLAGVYPTGMKLVATWCKEDRGLGIGILVGALTVGSAGPHLFAGLTLFGDSGLPSWRLIMLATSAQAVVAGILVLLVFRPGPYLSATAPFNWRFAGQLFAHKPTRLANFGYLGHMWEIYAMWTWIPLVLLESFHRAGWSSEWARLGGFAIIAVGGLGCVLAGRWADRFGRARITVYSLILSGSCALVAGHLVSYPALLTSVCLVWGFAVVADSAQYSAAVSELTDPLYVGTALTVQTSLGFLLTLLTIQVIPALAESLGWDYALSFLALGPIFGIASMLRLRQLPEAIKMAQGNR